MSELQLQFWTGKAYAPSAHQGEVNSDNARAIACGRPWRLAKPERALKPPKYSLRQTGTHRSAQDIQHEYLEWAQAKGLAHIVAYSTKPPLNRWDSKTHYGRDVPRGKEIYSGEFTWITPDKQFAVTEECDV